MSRPTKPVAMCFVSIGYGSRLLLPADKGMKLVEILQSAFECDQQFLTEDHAYSYVPKEQPSVEFTLVRPQQIRSSEYVSAQKRKPPLLLGSD